MCLLLGATGVGKTLLLKRLQSRHQPHRPYTPEEKDDRRELGGCMGPIWPKYYIDSTSVIFVVDCANIVQISSACVQLLSVLSAEPLHPAAVLILFNKRDLPCTMSLVELKSLFRIDEIIRTAPQSITTLEISARSRQGFQDVLSWLFSNHSHDT